MAVAFDSLLRNQHKICYPVPSNPSSRYSCARTAAGSCHRVGNHLHLPISVFRFQPQRGRLLRLNCSSTADAPRGSHIRLPTLYDLLEIPQHVGLPEIKVAYRQMALRYHPDVCPPTEREECTRRFLQVQEAYDTLSDPHLRAHYDLWLQNPLNTRTLTAGFRKGNRRGTGKSDIDAKDQWESQLHGLRNRGERGGKQESWASRMRKRRESDP